MGTYIKKSLRDFFLFVAFFGEILLEMAKVGKNRAIGLPVIVKQVLFTGVEALPIITIMALGVGGLIILQGYNILSTFGQSGLIQIILVSVVVRELSTIFTALIVIARSGTAIATELGNMVVSKEIDLIRSFRISPLTYLVASRVWGVVVAIFILTIYFNIAAVLGGWFFSSFFSRIDFSAFMDGFLNTLTLSDILMSLIKSVVFGVMIAVISCYQGLQVKYASTEVPQRTIKAVVHALVYMIIFDVLITWLFYLL